MNKNKTIFFPILFINLISYFILHAPLAQAQSALGLSAIPPRLEITDAKPGDVLTREIKVRNESQTDKYLTTSTTDFVVTDSQGTPLRVESLPDDSYSNRWAAANWLQVSPTKLHLKPGETKSLILTILVPEDVTPGGHYAMVLHTPQNEAVISGTGSTIETNVGTLVYITVPGDIQQSAKVAKFTAPIFSEYGPIDFKTIITNLSDIHISPIGTISIKNWFGGKTADLELEKLNIFPYTSREFQNNLAKKWLFGRYQAKLSAGYGTQGDYLSSVIYFWVIPWKLILTLLAIIIIVILLITLRRRPPTTNTKIEELEEELEELKKKYKDRK